MSIPAIHRQTSIPVVNRQTPQPLLFKSQPFGSVSEFLREREENTNLIVRIYRAVVRAFKGLFVSGDRSRKINQIIREKISLGKSARERHVLHVAFKHVFQKESYLNSLGVRKNRVLSRDDQLDLAGLSPKKYAERELESIRDYLRTHLDSELSGPELEKHQALLKEALEGFFSKLIKHERSFSQKKMLGDELSLKEREGIDLLIKVSTNEGQLKLSAKEKRKLKVFLKDAQGNMTLNRRISNIMEIIEKDKLDDKKLMALVSIHTYTYKTGQIKPFLKSAEKLTEIVSAIKKDPKVEIPNAYKLQLDEFGLLNSMLKLKTLLNFLEKAELIEEGSKLTVLNAALKKAGTAMNYLNGKYEKQAGYQSGDLLMYRGKDFSRFLNKDLDKMVDWQLSWLGSDYFHSALLNVPKKKMHISHVMDKAYEYNDAKLAQGTYTDAFRFKFDALVDEAVKPVLDEMAKKKNKKQGWNDLVGAKFRDIIEKMHQDRTEFEKIKNSKWRRLKSGIFPHVRRNWLFSPVSKPHERPFFEGKSEMICSEFAAKVLLTALVQLKNELTEEIAAELSVKENVTVEEAKERIAPGLITLPIPETEILSRLHTARLLEFLMPHLTRVERAPIIEQVLVS
ncbi:hypothetical protein [Estrella lausannensis]|uniref:Uncharacterized protein n=1 Tax=Estrella lausannensis TaxID=483423 RepID=A0A0H5DST9_9BACT|nr:hypothetical protein [Estrella lausannensis]CRX39393.1 hypothetical protein ELAC_2072 [Estrella lausannensis]